MGEQYSAPCPNCKKQVPVYPQRDGFNQPMLDKSFRVSLHSGPQWGRTCRGSNETVDRPAVSAGEKP